MAHASNPQRLFLKNFMRIFFKNPTENSSKSSSRNYLHIFFRICSTVLSRILPGIVLMVPNGFFKTPSRNHLEIPRRGIFRDNFPGIIRLLYKADSARAPRDCRKVNPRIFPGILLKISSEFL